MVAEKISLQVFTSFCKKDSVKFYSKRPWKEWFLTPFPGSNKSTFISNEVSISFYFWSFSVEEGSDAAPLELCHDPLDDLARVGGEADVEKS